MKTAEQKIPYKISEYVNNYFREDFLIDVKEVKTQGDVHYHVDVSKDNFEYKLLFNKKGDLLKQETKDAFPPDIHEGPVFGEVPD